MESGGKAVFVYNRMFFGRARTKEGGQADEVFFPNGAGKENEGKRSSLARSRTVVLLPFHLI